MGNKYVNRSKISEAKFRELVRFFSLDLTATQIAELSGLNRNTVNRYLKGIRKRIAEHCRATAPFTGINVNWLSNTGNREVVWLGIREQDGMIYTLLSDRQHWPDNLNKKHEIDLFVNLKTGKRHWSAQRKQLQNKNPSKINCIDGFRGFVKARLEKFKGIHSQTYVLHLKECEFRYNNPKSKLYPLILKIARNRPLF
jgi:transposase